MILRKLNLISHKLDLIKIKAKIKANIRELKKTSKSDSSFPEFCNVQSDFMLVESHLT